MSTRRPADKPEIPSEANFVSGGRGTPVVLIHGLSASLHDWDSLIPALTAGGYSAYAPDLLGHGDSPKPALPLYQMEWLVDHFVQWLEGLRLGQPVVLIGHSLGGYLALEYARRYPEHVRGLVLVDPFYSNSQLAPAMQFIYAHPTLTRLFVGRGPKWLIRAMVDFWSMAMGHGPWGSHALSEEVRDQTAVDYLRTSPAVYGILNPPLDLRPYLGSIPAPTLVVWGEHDETLFPASFQELARRLPNGQGKSIATGHVPHQAEPDWFNRQVLEFLGSLPPDANGGPAANPPRNQALGTSENGGSTPALRAS